MNPPRLKKPFASPTPPRPAGGSKRSRVNSSTKALALLLIHEHAEEIKQTTISLRQAYSGCRVEAVYSAEEALEWGSKQDWSVILLDEQLAHRNVFDLVAELRRSAPSSVIIVQAEHHDTRTAAKVIQAGADLFLYKKSPAFLMELPIVVRGMLEQRMLQKELAAERERHSCLIEHFPGLLYELDADGRFVAVGTGVMTLLGYSPKELIGTHYSTLLHPDEWQLARQHLHERRTGLRAQHGKSVRLIGKHGGIVQVVCQTAGLYGQHRQFLGTVGTIEHSKEGSSAATTPPQPYGGSLQAAPPPFASPSIAEPQAFYTERRRAGRVSVQMEASLHLRDTAFSGFVRDISLANVYVVIEGTPAVTRDHRVRLDFFLEGAILQVQGRIADVRHLFIPPDTPQGQQQPRLGLVILYSDLGAIEGPILSSLLEELRVRRDCAKLTLIV